jgi:hypothetical protein
VYSNFSFRTENILAAGKYSFVFLALVQTKVLHLELSSGGLTRGSPATYELEKLQSIVCISKSTQQNKMQTQKAASSSRPAAKLRQNLAQFSLFSTLP